MKTSSANGFTLIEVLIALALFAVVAALGYRGVDQVLRNQTALRQHNQAWRNLERCFDLFQSDALSMVDRSIRDQYGIARPGLVAETDANGPWDDAVEWSRLRTETVGGIERVGYRWREDRLERIRWPNPDRGPRDAPSVTTVLSGVTAFSLRFQAADGRFDDAWHLPQHTGLPVLIELTIEQDGRRWVRQFLVGVR